LIAFFEERRESRMAKQKNNNFPNTTCACPESTMQFSLLLEDELKMK